MKLNKIWLFFYTALPVSVALRIYQLLFTIDGKTGFYTETSGNYGIILLVLIFLFAAAVLIFGFFTHNRPENPPKTNLFLSFAILPIAATILYESFISNVPISMIGWQNIACKGIGIIAIAFFLWYALSYNIVFRTPPALTTIPVIYFTVRLVCDFTAISKLALISDNIILILTYCVTLLFWLNFAKLYNNVGTEKNFKNLLATGLCSAILSLVNSIPNIFVNIISENEYMHTPMTTNNLFLFNGLFIIVFLHSHFSKKNLSK